MSSPKSELIVEHVSDKLVRLKRRIDGGFKLKADWAPSGDQPQAIDKLVENLSDGLAHQTLLGVTGSGKTYTIANVIQRTQRPTMILAPNKTLAGQLYGEFKEFFPDNAVEYFVSYYDYYQPEAYVPSSDTFIEKDSAINEHIEQMRLSATKALMERKDAIIVASVSAIYGLGNPEAYFNMVLHLVKGDKLGQREIIRRLTEMQYVRNDVALARGTYRVRGDIIDIHPAESDEEAVRVELFDDEVDGISYFDPLTGEVRRRVPRATVYAKSHYVTPKERMMAMSGAIKDELQERIKYFADNGKLLEAQRIEQRTTFDLEMIQEIGYCNGIENYSRYLTGREPGEPPPCLFDYLPPDALVVIDESHVTVPQIGGMYKGDRARKETLVAYGFHARNNPHAIIDLTIFRLQTFTASVVGGAFMRIAMGATPFLLAMLLQIGFGLSAFAAGTMTFVSAAGALVMKTTAPPILRRYGFRTVLIVNAVIVGLSFMAYGLFKPSTPHWIILTVLAIGGFFRSLQFTSLNGMAYAEVEQDRMSRASTTSSMAQQLVQSVGIGIAATLLHALMVAQGQTRMTAETIAPAFVIIGAITFISLAFFIPLPRNAGDEMNGRD